MSTSIQSPTVSEADTRGVIAFVTACMVSYYPNSISRESEALEGFTPLQYSPTGQDLKLAE